MPAPFAIQQPRPDTPKSLYPLLPAPNPYNPASSRHFTYSPLIPLKTNITRFIRRKPPAPNSQPPPTYAPHQPIRANSTKRNFTAPSTPQTPIPPHTHSNPPPPGTRIIPQPTFLFTLTLPPAHPTPHNRITPPHPNSWPSPAPTRAANKRQTEAHH
ncbi:extensin-like [Penaeus chinensis]|uniref:extensin-like n=1 Tax=Penaeus chinensis TaxID=139456 RepID=UPI001FB7A5F1|nr:extensin-like [Penaeus chinensis]